tara:strand:- start:9 stop:851 length:843 start_codon:yes stop_codon:yes gene_type:complete
MKNLKIGIIGMGYVGTATFNGLKNSYNVASFDINKPSTYDTLNELANFSDLIFVCLPTPMNKSGECDLSIIDNVLSKLNSLFKDKIVVIKSTCIPGTSKKFQENFKNLKIVFNPEFLREKFINEDFVNQKFIILGGLKKYTKVVKDMYSHIFPTIKYFQTDLTTAEMVKYTINNFLALKVSFANEIFDICEVKNINYEDMINIAISDLRLGNSHWAVPGHDGKRGYGGSCFPKDVSALYSDMSKLNLVSYIIKASYDRNRELDRADRDWEQLVGRAVSEE